MSQVTDYVPGQFCWLELSTSDPEAAKGFYGDLFGWTFHDTPAGPGQVFTFIRLHGDDIGAMYSMPERQRGAGVPVHWLGYLATADVDATAARVVELGGRVLAEPYDSGSAGRGAIVADDQGGAFGLWQAGSHPGARRVDEPGTAAWHTLLTHSPQRAGEFFGALFGWGLRGWNEETGYSEWLRAGGGGAEPGEDDVPFAGVMPLGERYREGTPHWLHVLAVEDVDACASRAQALGGEVVVAPIDIPGAGRYALLVDPQGAAFGVMRFE